MMTRQFFRTATMEAFTGDQDRKLSISEVLRIGATKLLPQTLDAPPGTRWFKHSEEYLLPAEIARRHAEPRSPPASHLRQEASVAQTAEQEAAMV